MPASIVKKKTTVPLKPGKATIAANGLLIKVKRLDQENGQGKAVVSYPVNVTNPFPFDIVCWQIIDAQGKLRPTNPVTSNKAIGIALPRGAGQIKSLQPANKSSDHLLELEWEMPAGHNAVALLNSGCWEYHENLDIFKIEIPDNQ